MTFISLKITTPSEILICFFEGCLSIVPLSYYITVYDWVVIKRNIYQLDFFMPVIFPDLISFKKTCLEKEVEEFSRFLFIVYKHLLVTEILEFALDKVLNFKNAFHLSKLKKLKFLNMDFNINCCFSTILIFKRNFLSFISSFFICRLINYVL
jgi:hypothetical protein